jgi:hypothetical protein
MKRTTGILVCTLAVGMAWAQNPQIIQNTRTQLNTVQQNTTAASNDALGIKQSGTKTPAAKPIVTPVKSSAAVVKTSTAPAKASVVPVKASVAPVKATASATPKSAEPFKAKKPVSASSAPKIGVKQITVKKAAKPPTAQKQKKTAAAAPKKSAEPVASSSSDAASATSSEAGKGDDDAVKDAQEKKWSMSGKRDPFISPVVSRAGGSGCSTGKKCLEIGAINLRGVVHSDGGFIAVVTNNLNKAYFLRENDPVFDGYVVKITGDSIVFKETMQDRLGKSFTREVTKKITTPAV